MNLTKTEIVKSIAGALGIAVITYLMLLVLQ